MQDKMILTSGPSITQKEIDYVVDAVKNGIDEHWGDYLKRFEKAFAEYIGVRYAMTTSSCTGALHLALVALGIGRGDEVIVPDMSWIATGSAVMYVGAKPVFVDVCKDTWCIDPECIKKAITGRTKAIIPVHLYGQPCEMVSIMEIAKENNLYVIEDAAPSVGADILGKHTGSFGHIGCFSFQGAKMVSTGEGGMIVTDDPFVFERIKHYAEHGRASSGFEISDIGYKYKMSNYQAALGLGQIERVEELIAKKVLINSWYREELKDIPLLMLNTKNTASVKSIYWMSSIVLLNAPIKRDRVMEELKAMNIDTRPFFPPMSSFPMFLRRFNLNAEYLGSNGINLPSGHRITQEEVVYVCNCIKKILFA